MEVTIHGGFVICSPTIDGVACEHVKVIRESKGVDCLDRDSL